MGNISGAYTHLVAADETNDEVGAMFRGTQDDLAAALTALDNAKGELPSVADVLDNQSDVVRAIAAKAGETQEHLSRADEDEALTETSNARALVEHQEESVTIISDLLNEAKEQVLLAVGQLDEALMMAQKAIAQADEADRSVGGAKENIQQAISRLT